MNMLLGLCPVGNYKLFACVLVSLMIRVLSSVLVCHRSCFSGDRPVSVLYVGTAKKKQQDAYSDQRDRGEDAPVCAASAGSYGGIAGTASL